ncbi:TPA: hypothetical protein KQG29_001462 [Clostridioides difficile]|nr:hypothetical protein [Clostridioides difficile]
MSDIIVNEIYKTREKMLILSIKKYESSINNLFDKLNYLKMSEEQKDSINKIIDELENIKNAIEDIDISSIPEEIEDTFQNYISGKVPIAIKIKGKRFNVKTWQDLFEVVVNYFAELDKDKFLESVENYPYILSNKNESLSNKNENLRYIQSVDLYLKIKDVGYVKIKRFLNLLTSKFDFDMENDIKLIFKS